MAVRQLGMLTVEVDGLAEQAKEQLLVHLVNLQEHYMLVAAAAVDLIYPVLCMAELGDPAEVALDLVQEEEMALPQRPIQAVAAVEDLEERPLQGMEGMVHLA